MIEDTAILSAKGLPTMGLGSVGEGEGAHYLKSCCPLGSAGSIPAPGTLNVVKRSTRGRKKGCEYRIKPPFSRNLLEDLYNEFGLTATAEHLGCTKNKLSYWLIKFGIRKSVEGQKWQKKPSYYALHARVRKARGTPQKCETCGTTEGKSHNFHWANLTGKYEDINDYIRECKSCHAKRDNAITNIFRPHGAQSEASR